MDKAYLEALLSSLAHWTVFFTALVVIGVGGELVEHVLYSRASGQLIALQHAEEKSLQAEITRLGNSTAEANASAAQANERAKQMEMRTEELKRENLEIQRRIANRFLPDTQKSALLESLKPHKGHGIIIARLGYAQAGIYADNIIKLFEQAGSAIQLNQVGTLSPPAYGLRSRVSVHPDPAIQSAIAAGTRRHLASALHIC